MFIKSEPLCIADLPDTGSTVCGHFHDFFYPPGHKDIVFLGAAQFVDRDDAWRVPKFADWNVLNPKGSKFIWTGSPIYAPFRLRSREELEDFALVLMDRRFKEVWPHLHLELEMPSHVLSQLDTEDAHYRIMEAGVHTVQFMPVVEHRPIRVQKSDNVFTIKDALSAAVSTLPVRRKTKKKVVEKIHGWI
jgi:hypothetical protein